MEKGFGLTARIDKTTGFASPATRPLLPDKAVGSGKKVGRSTVTFAFSHFRTKPVRLFGGTNPRPVVRHALL